MSFLNKVNQALTWWNGQTINTRIWTSRHGVKVGEDDQGNIYYKTSDDAKRWVIFNGEAEATRVAPEWHSWLHRTSDTPPSEKPMPHKTWEKPHQENLTGTAMAYAPAGSIRKGVPAERRDYEAWSPE